jgi:hypothetical protein
MQELQNNASTISDFKRDGIEFTDLAYDEGNTS